MNDTSAALPAASTGSDELFATETALAAARRAALLDALAQAPYAQDFFALLRRIETLWPAAPRLGSALRPGAEPLRFGQDPELSFAPAAIASFEARAGRTPRLGVRFFGLFGPMGPLPLHVTEYARDRLRNHGDASFARFADVFHHRMLLLFYRAWAQAQPTVQADRPHDDRYATWVGALFGQAPTALRGADSVPDAARRFVAAQLARPTRNPEAIEKVLRQYFVVPIRVESHVGHWMSLRSSDRSRLGVDDLGRSGRLGISAIAGSKVWDRQYKLRIHIGPLTLAQYLQFLPGRRSLVELRDWLRQLLGFELLWELRLVLAPAEVPAVQLGPQAAHRAALGLSSWLCPRAPRRNAGELTLHPTQLSARTLQPKGSDHG